MIRHIVALRFSPGIAAEDKAQLFSDLAALDLPGLSGFRAFGNVSPEVPVVHGFADLFWIDFHDAGARDAYLADPGHQAIGARLVQACGGLAGIQVLDVDL